MTSKKIAFQGILGSFSYLASLKFFGEKNNFYGLETFKEVFKGVNSKKFDFGVIPIENSIVGSIYENYDYLANFKIKVIGEVYLRIHHYLLGVKIPNISLQKRLKLIKEVYSHPKALEQCQRFFESYPWIKKVNFSDTAGAAQFVSQKNDPSLGAISSKICAKLYNLEVILEKIEDDPQNYTRFLIISSKELESPKANKCSLIFYLPHKPGALYKSLEIFAKQEINLTKIESRPIIGKPFEYVFYLDFEFNPSKHNLDLILKEFKKQVLKMKVLGKYEKGKTYQT